METQEQDLQAPPSQESTEGLVPKGAKTSDYYKTKDIPNRFENPEWFEGYGGKSQHPMYKTTSNQYGSRAPSVHTMPTSFHCRSQKFSEHLGKCGNYRNHSLNTGMDHSKV